MIRYVVRPAAVCVLSTLSGALLIATSCAQARSSVEARPDFAGRWTLDPQATETMGGGRGDASGNATGGGGGTGGGTGLGPAPQEMTIQQDSTRLMIAESGGPGGTVTIIYRLDGTKTTNSMPVGRGGIAQAVYSSRWDGSRLVTSITRSVSSRGGAVNVEYRERRYLAADGSMVVETTVQGRQAGRKAVYRKTAGSEASHRIRADRTALIEIAGF